MNAGWNICNNRRGEYLHKLRESIRFDKDKLTLSDNGISRIYVWKKYLEYFFVGLKVNYIKLYDAFVKNISNFKSLHQTVKSTRVRRKRKSLLNNYRSEHVIGTNELISHRSKTSKNLTNNKYHKEIKEKRHKDETKWNDLFYEDLDLQERFDKIEYVDTQNMNEFYEASLEYLEEREQLKDNNYKNEWGEIQNENHFIAHLENDDDVVVLEEEWFKQYDDEGKFSHHIIITQIFRNILRRKNRPVSLNKQDKRKIKKTC